MPSDIQYSEKQSHANLNHISINDNESIFIDQNSNNIELYHKLRLHLAKYFNIPRYVPQRARGISNYSAQEIDFANLMQYVPYDIDSGKFQLSHAAKAQKIVCEIGFGTGERTIRQALAEPSTLFICCDAYVFGLLRLKRYINQHKLTNIYLWPGDGCDLLKQIPDQFLNELYVLFPDPWPKKRQYKRRIIQKSFLHLAQHKIKHNCGKLLIATDHPNYKEHLDEVILEQFNQSQYYTEENQANINQDDISYTVRSLLINSTLECEKYQILTRYAEKALEKQNAIHVFELIFH